MERFTTKELRSLLVWLKVALIPKYCIVGDIILGMLGLLVAEHEYGFPSNRAMFNISITHFLSIRLSVVTLYMMPAMVLYK